jgi:hypothetical protein
VRGGTAKVLILFRPSDGRVRIEGTRNCPNTVLHPWLKRELGAILAELPVADPTADASRAAWERWQAGLSVRITLPEELPTLRVLLVLDNLVGHKTPALVLWLFAHGVMPLFTPVAGSWLNMAESIQRVLKRRALNGEYPTDADEIMTRVESVARHWNAAPTIRLGWQAGGSEEARTRATACRGWVRSMDPATDSTMLWPCSSQVTH